MSIADKYSRECLSIEVERSVGTEDVVATFASLFRSRGEPTFIRSDNGPEFVATAFRWRWLKASGAVTLYRAGQSVGERVCGVFHRAFVRPFGGSAAEEKVFTSLMEAKVLVE